MHTHNKNHLGNQENLTKKCRLWQENPTVSQMWKTALPKGAGGEGADWGNFGNEWSKIKGKKNYT